MRSHCHADACSFFAIERKTGLRLKARWNNDSILGDFIFHLRGFSIQILLVGYKLLRLDKHR